MAHFRISDDIEDHPHFFELSDRAFRVWVYAGTWCQRHLTDGIIPLEMAISLRRSSASVVHELTSSGLFVQDGVTISLCGYLKHNDSREKVQQRRELLLERQARWRGKERVTVRVTNALLPDARNAVSNAVNNGVPNLTSPNLIDPKGSKTGSPSSPSASRSAPGFDEFWAVYPRKIGKDAARRKWAQKHPPLGDVLAAIELQRQSEQWTSDGGRYIPHPATWLHQGRWQDEVSAEPASVPAAEYARAEKYRQSAWGRCRHDPKCESYAECVTAIARHLRTQQEAV